jgi:hypothetical protein
LSLFATASTTVTDTGNTVPKEGVRERITGEGGLKVAGHIEGDDSRSRQRWSVHWSLSVPRPDVLDCGGTTKMSKNIQAHDDPKTQNDEQDAEQVDEHLEDVEDGCGCTEIWEHLSDRREAADD